MPNYLAETPNFDQVLRLELNTPVQGGDNGASNTPLQQLASRDAYLKQVLDALTAGTTIPPTVASKDNALLTGDPKAPTPPLGDRDTSISTTAFVQDTISGVLLKDVSGNANVTLSAVEAGNGILKLSGVLTGAVAVIAPSGIKQKWTVINGTSGAFPLSVKTAAGASVVVAQGYSQSVFSDGTGVYPTVTDFTDTALLGNPTAKTQTTGDSSQRLANTEFVTLAVSSAIPAGAVIGFARTTAPTGYLKCNGAAVSRSAYAALFAAIGTTFGAGDGSTTFNLPDYRGEFPRFLDDGRGVDSGRALAAAQAAAFASHNHGVNDPGHAHSVYDPGHNHGVSDPGHAHSAVRAGIPYVDYDDGQGQQVGEGTTSSNYTGIAIAAAVTSIGIYSAYAGISTAAAGGSETRPRNIALLACIKY